MAKVGQIYRSNDKREQGGKTRHVKVVGFQPGDFGGAETIRVTLGEDMRWHEDTVRITTIRVASLGTTRQTGYTLVEDLS
jgi:hypothetical protein